jgi:uncharacterized alpha/beta hydrolase family protein
MKSILFSVVTLCSINMAWGQSDNNRQALVKGRVLSELTRNAVGELEVVIPELKLLTTTDGLGDFALSQVKYGNYHIILRNGYSINDTLKVAVDQDVVDLGVLYAKVDEAATSATSGQMPTIALEESAASADDEGIKDQNISGVLTASRDPYLAAAAFTFGPLRYQLRGYSRDQLEVYMNGLPMNDLEMGSAFFGQWGGLNDVFRNQSVVFGLQPGEEGFGGLTGSSGINATAAAQRQQTRISYALSNRTYRNRLMVTHSTGLMKNGWAFSVSASKRWAKEGYIEGTSYDGYSYYLGISKKLSNKSMLHFTTFGAPTERGKAMPSTQEAMDLMGNNFYNPNWGYQNGEKRNARMNKTFQPVAILNYEYKPNSSTLLNIAGSFQTGYNGNSLLDWYNAADPRPDYYRKLPSYTNFDDQNNFNPHIYDATQAKWLSDPQSVGQINWDNLYDQNRYNVSTVNGVTGKRSAYVIGEDRDDVKKYNFAINLKKAVNEHLTLYSSVNVIHQNTESYRQMLDLLGGDYYVNLNQFAERTYIGNSAVNQVDLNNPNGIIRVGDKYSYDYRSKFTKSYWWGQAVFNYNKVDFFLSGRFGVDAFNREGLFQNGLFPNNSFGAAATQRFVTYQVKGGLTYKINGRNYLFVNGGLMTNAPTFDNTYISPRTRDITVSNPQVEKIKTVEGGYLLRSPNLNARITAFATDITDATNIKRFYYEGYNTFVNYVMQNVNIRNIGGEVALQAKLSPSFSATGVISWKQVFYTNRPKAEIYADVDTTIKVSGETIYLKDYYVAAGPQTAATIGLNYRSPKYWYANINVNYTDRNYIDINPVRLTENAVGTIARGSELWNTLLVQEKLPSAFTVDLFAGKSFLLSKALKFLPKNTFLYLNVGVNNILDNKKIITGGFEQLRLDSGGNLDRFPPKYFYGYGRNYFVNVSLKF